jgi:hypothetical protein
MNLRIPIIYLTVTVLAVSLGAPQAAYATLGEKSDSISMDRKAISARLRATTSHSKYTVQEVANSAVAVREYVTPSGIVFGVAWNGVVQPDLTVLLGSYAGDYQQAREKQPQKHGQRRAAVKGSRVVVETWGQMRNLQGRAYDPALIPEGVTADDIR